MITDLKPYAEYKEAGLPWLGPVPVRVLMRTRMRMQSQSRNWSLIRQ